MKLSLFVYFLQRDSSVFLWNANAVVLRNIIVQQCSIAQLLLSILLNCGNAARYHGSRHGCSEFVIRKCYTSSPWIRWRGQQESRGWFSVSILVLEQLA